MEADKRVYDVLIVGAGRSNNPNMRQLRVALWVLYRTVWAHDVRGTLQDGNQPFCRRFRRSC